MITDMTVGSPVKVLWKFSIPMLISAVFQQIYNIADSVIAGQFAGENALAAVGASYPITMIFMAIAMGCNIGCSVIISQLFGGKQNKLMKTAIYTTFISCGVLSVVLTLLGILLCSSLMTLLQTPLNIFEDSALYLRIYIFGLVFLFLYNICTGIFNALGDSKTPLYFLIGSSIGNIILDLVFVAVFKMGVSGVAWATFIAQGVSAILAIITLIKRVRKIETQEKPELFSISMLKKISLIAIPSILQQSFISVGNLFVQTIINSYGSSVIAGYSASIKLNTFAVTSFTTLGSAMSSFTAQNIGSNTEFNAKTARIKSGFKAGAKITLIIAIPFFLIYFVLANGMLNLFLDSSSVEAIKTGRIFLQIVSPFYFVIAVKLMADGVLRGTGSMKQFMIATFSDLVIRVALAYILSSIIGSNGVWMSWPIGWCVGLILSYYFYRSDCWVKSM